MWSGPLQSLSRVSLDDLDDYGQALWLTLGLPSGAKSIRPGDSAQTTAITRACMRSHFHLPSERQNDEPADQICRPTMAHTHHHCYHAPCMHTS